MRGPPNTNLAAELWLVGLPGFEPGTKGFTFVERFPFRVDYLFTLEPSN
jgi:hypothetical protein